jgi:hypothetical protein
LTTIKLIKIGEKKLLECVNMLKTINNKDKRRSYQKKKPNFNVYNITIRDLKGDILKMNPCGKQIHAMKQQQRL